MSFSSPLFAVFALLFGLGCGRSFEALTSDGDPDGGLVDGDLADAPFCSSDACGFEPDAGDAGVVQCLPGGWEPPRTPVLFDASATVPAVVDHDGSTFYLAFLNGNPSPCDGACPVVMEATFDAVLGTGETSFVMPAYWSDAVTTARLDARKAGSSSNLLLTAVSDAQVAWQWRPLRRESWQNDGTFDFSDPIYAARRVADVAPLGDHAIPTRASRIAIVHLPDTADEEGYFDDLQVVAVDESGTSVTYDDLFVVDGVRAPRVVDGSAWIAAIQNWDFPPTVQLVQIGSETVGIAGTSCGVEGFDAVAASDGRVVVAQDCRDRSEIGGVVELELRGVEGAEGPRVTVSQRRSFVPSRVASLPPTISASEGFAVAVVEQGASSPTLVVVHRVEDGLEVRESMRMPVAEGLRLPITAVDVVARHDRTVLVTWTGTPADPDDLWAWEGPEAAFAIVPRCLCADADCF
jgi:hypothetical protein